MKKSKFHDRKYKINSLFRIMSSGKYAVTGVFGVLGAIMLLTGCGASVSHDEVILRVTNWEEYIDEGDWDEDEIIDLEDGIEIIGENKMIEDFEEWYKDEYGLNVKVEYSTFGTNEELYNQLTLGDTFDLVCPSEYMIMKLLSEGKLEQFSDDFYDSDNENNYYINGVSVYKKYL